MSDCMFFPLGASGRSLRHKFREGQMGMGQKQTDRGTADFNPCFFFHLPGFQLGYLVFFKPLVSFGPCVQVPKGFALMFHIRWKSLLLVDTERDRPILETSICGCVFSESTLLGLVQRDTYLKTSMSQATGAPVRFNRQDRGSSRDMQARARLGTLFGLLITNRHA